MGSSLSRPVNANGTVDNEKDTPSIRSLDDCLSSLRINCPQSLDGSISSGNVHSWESSVASNPKLRLGRTILSHTDLRSALTSRDALVADQHVFNTQIDFKTDPITNQKSSGRCWIFATTNVLRYDIMKKLKLKEFQLSQSYLFFWDKLNKSNYYLELTIELADRPLDDRLVNHLSGDLISDGGQWDMVVNLLETYGVVPQAVYPESYHSSQSGPLNSLLKTKLREHALVLRRLSSSLSETALSKQTILSILRAKKEELMKEVYTVMTATLGVPPCPDDKFVWEFNDEAGKARRWEGTPKAFYQTFASKCYPPSDSFSLINDPRNEYSRLYTVDKLGNIWGGRPVLYVNTDVKTLKTTIVKMIKAGQPVFFGCDVGQFSSSTAGIMDTSLFKYEDAFDIMLSLSKAERLQVSESSMTHAMVISAVHLDPTTNKPLRYRVENSWGEGAGEKGYFVMTDAWFDEFVYQVVVPKALAPRNLVEVLETDDRIVLPPWDPMGSLA